MTQITAELNGELVDVAGTYRDADAIKLVPGTRWNTEQRVWKAPLAWTTCHALRGVFGQQLAVGPLLTEWAARELETWVNPARIVRELEDAPGDPLLLPRQRVGVRMLETSRQLLLADEMGTGKTIQAAVALRELRELGYASGPVLVVSPNGVKRGWRRELEIWCPNEVVEVVEGGAAARRKQLKRVLDGEVTIAVINWEALRLHSRLAPYGSTRLKRCQACGGDDPRVKETSCETHVKELNLIDFSVVIADEAHRAKNAQAKQTRALWAAAGKAPYRWALTGTPIANTPDDLWAILHFLNPREWSSRVSFITRFCAQSWSAFGGLQVTGLRPDTEPELRQTLDVRMLRRTRKEMLPETLEPLPPERRDVFLTPKERKVYNQMRDQLVAELDSGTLVGWNPLTQLTRLRQLASSNGEVILAEDGSVDEVKLIEPSSKLDELEATLEDLGDEPVVIAASSRQLIQLLEARFEKSETDFVSIHGQVSPEDRDVNQQRFQAGEVQYCLLTMAAGGVGINLQRASIIVFLQRDFSLILNKQTRDRVDRYGQTRPIQEIDLVSADTVEELVIERVLEKGERLEEVVQDRARLRRLLTGDEDG